jgi:hydroxymethylbilane synthase
VVRFQKQERDIELIRIGTRGSRLARLQTEFVQSRITNIDTRITVIRTRGDRDRKSPFTNIPESSLFTRELEEALLGGEIDLAVHSLKDLASSLPEGLVIAAYTGLRSRCDAFISTTHNSMNDVPKDGVIGTSSPRRQACILSMRDDLQISEIRGNVTTRLSKIDEIGLDGIILAAAGLERLGLEGCIREYLPVETFVPSSGQGILAVQCREGEEQSWSHLDDPELRAAAEIEARFMRELQVGCSKPVGIHAVADRDESGNRRFVVYVFISNSSYSFFFRKKLYISSMDEVTSAVSRMKGEIEAQTGKPFSL